ncbi:hypothetical protein RhiLY_05232 [Ceratobasidium sp. AG-Ba]|nr:hypothetical protein RhiLY_05232 [Ceratobasidium sp. AG-Ba]
MRVITLNYDPLDCTCWFPSANLYCDYCDSVCDAALADFEAGVGDWTFFGVPDALSKAEEAAHAAALAEFFEEGSPPEDFGIPLSRVVGPNQLLSSFPEERPITPPPVPPRSPSPDPFQALLDGPPEVDVPWSVPRPRFVRAPVFAVSRVKKPYDRPVSRKRKGW